MNALPPVGPAAQTPPWQQKQLSTGVKLLLTLVTVLLIIALFVALFVAIGSLTTLGRRGSAGSSMIALVVSVVVFAVSLLGLIKLYPLVSAPTNFKPAYGAVPPDARGQPFETRFKRNLGGRSFSGKGMLRFDAEGLQIEGYLTPSALFQLGVVVVVTVVPLVVLGIGLGILPALIIAYYLGRKKLTSTIAYADMRDLQLKGCQLSFRNESAIPRKLSLYVATSDGERLYRELYDRFPAALSMAGALA